MDQQSPVSSGVGWYLSPTTIITGCNTNFTVHCKLEFGAYTQVHDFTKHQKLGEARTLGVVCLGPSGNMQGGYIFLSLTTREILYRSSWTDLPIPDTVIHRVEQLSTWDRQPAALEFTFELGLEVGYLTPYPGKEANDETGFPTVKGVDAQEIEQNMKDYSNVENPCDTGESN